jgi:hypothetical protein
MADIFTRSRTALPAADDLPALVGRRLAYRTFGTPAKDVGRPSARRRRQLAPLSSQEINERLLALLCTCAAAAIGALWVVTYLRG